MEQLCFCQRDGLDISIPTFSISRTLAYVIVNLITQGWIQDFWISRTLAYVIVNLITQGWIQDFWISRTLAYVIVNLITQGWIQDFWKGVHANHISMCLDPHLN